MLDLHSGALVLSRNVTIDGGGLITISGNNAVGTFNVNGGVTAELRGLALTLRMQFLSVLWTIAARCR